MSICNQVVTEQVNTFGYGNDLSLGSGICIGFKVYEVQGAYEVGDWDLIGWLFGQFVVKLSRGSPSGEGLPFLT